MIDVLSSGDRVLEWEMLGESLAGVGTSFVFPSLSVAFDVGGGYLQAQRARQAFVTHGHMDHCGGVPFLISQKSLNNLPPGTFYVPVSIVEPLDRIIRTWGEIEGHQYQYELVGMKSGDRAQLKGPFWVEAFEATHRIPTLGYSLMREKKSLRSDLVGLPQEKIIERRRRGESVEILSEERLVSYTGDTTIEIFERSPQVLDSKVLILEVTYFDDRKPVAEAREWGHIHLDEFLNVLPYVKSELIVLAHRSRRYSFAEAREICTQKIPSSLHPRIRVFSGANSVS